MAPDDVPVRTYVMCQVRLCGRPFIPTVHDDEWGDWLMASHLDTGLTVIRCPRHLTRWCFRQCGVPWTRAVRNWATDALLRDQQRYPVIVPDWSHPVPMSEHVHGIHFYYSNIMRDLY